MGRWGYLGLSVLFLFFKWFRLVNYINKMIWIIINSFYILRELGCEVVGSYLYIYINGKVNVFYGYDINI